jgi:hypothetical protein
MARTLEELAAEFAEPTKAKEDRRSLQTDPPVRDGLPVVGTRADDFGKVETPTAGIPPIRFTLDPLQKVLDQLTKEIDALDDYIDRCAARRQGLVQAMEVVEREMRS